MGAIPSLAATRCYCTTASTASVCPIIVPYAALGAGVAPDTMVGRLVGPGPPKGQERAWFAKP